MTDTTSTRAETAKQENARTLFHEGIQLILENRHKDAIPVFREVIELTPEFPGGFYNLALCQSWLGDMDDSYQTFQQALVLAPSHPGTNLNAGKCALSLDKAEEAARLFTIALENGAEPAGALIGRGLALCQNNELAAACNDFRAVPQSHDNYWMAQHYLGCALLERERFADAIQALQMADQFQPGRTETMEMLFLALCKDQKHAEALELFSTLAELEPSVRIRYSEEIRLARQAIRIPLKALPE